jgi:leader peptidase (prepilin peptidase) / N-methyltransferase
MEIIFLTLLALALGSFANCLIWRLYVNKSIKGRSICPKCKHQLAWYDNIPLISFLLLKGKCRYCQKKISWQYFLVEFSLAILFILAWHLASDDIYLFIKLCLAIFLLLIIFVFDLRYYLIPINLLLIMSPLIYLVNLLSGISWYLPLFFSLILIIFFLIQYIITNKKGIGEGDIWLGGSIGLMLAGWTELFIVILVSYLLGSLVGIVLMILKKKKWQSKLPLGVFLSFGTIISLFWADYLWAWFLQLLI